MDYKLQELCIDCLKTDAANTEPFNNESVCPTRTGVRDRERQRCDQMIIPGSLSDHQDVCPQALLSLSLSVCLFVSLKCFSEWREVPRFPYKSPGTINRKMKDRPVNAGRCFERIKRLETDGFAQWHGTFLSQAVTPLSQLVYIRTTSAAWEPSTDTVKAPVYRITFSVMTITMTNQYTLIQHLKALYFCIILKIRQGQNIITVR